jgi:hypothetical protein
MNYEAAYSHMSGLYQFGRFAMFLYLEAVHVVTGFPMEPRTMDLREAESCRNGLALAIGRPDLNRHGTTKASGKEIRFLQHEFDKLVLESKFGVWNLETTLCAYKKYRMGKRFIGYYLARQRAEIRHLQNQVRDGVDWSVLWDYRRETYDEKFTRED